MTTILIFFQSMEFASETCKDLFALVFSDFFFFMRKISAEIHFRAKTPLVKTKVGGGQKPFSTIRFLEVRKQNMENLFLPKVLYVTKDCLKNLARAEPQKTLFWSN